MTALHQADPQWPPCSVLGPTFSSCGWPTAVRMSVVMKSHFQLSTENLQKYRKPWFATRSFHFSPPKNHGVLGIGSCNSHRQFWKQLLRLHALELHHQPPATAWVAAKEKSNVSDHSKSRRKVHKMETKEAAHGLKPSYSISRMAYHLSKTCNTTCLKWFPHPKRDIFSMILIIFNSFQCTTFPPWEVYQSWWNKINVIRTNMTLSAKWSAHIFKGKLVDLTNQLLPSIPLSTSHLCAMCPHVHLKEQPEE